MRIKRLLPVVVFLICCMGISAADMPDFQNIIEISKRGNWALLGNWWLISDGIPQKQFIPKQPEFFHSPKAFFDGRNKLIYTRQSVQKTAILAVYDLSNRSSEDLATIPEEAFAVAPAPDKCHIAFVGAQGVLRVLEVQSQKIQDLAPAWSFAIPSWSPDSNSIAFEKNRERDQGSDFSEIATVSLASGRVTVLEKGRSPSWSPSGDTIAYIDTRGRQLEAIAPDGRHHRILKGKATFRAYEFIGPLVWSPDQQNLIYHAATGIKGDHPEAYLLNLNSNGVKKLGDGLIVVGWK